jgi:RNA polymerase sigma-70 factor (ECF subfamily)
MTAMAISDRSDGASSPAPGPPSDLISAVAAARAGDAAAWDSLIEAYYARVLRYLTQLTRDPDLAADLTQDVFERAVTRLDQLTSNAAFGPWLYRIARNGWVSMQRRRRVRRFVSLDWLIDHGGDEPFGGQACEPIEQWPERDLVQQALDRVSPSTRDLLYLRHVDGFSSAQIGMILDVSPTAAQRRINRAEQQFRGCCRALEGQTMIPEDGRT